MIFRDVSGGPGRGTTYAPNYAWYVRAWEKRLGMWVFKQPHKLWMDNLSDIVDENGKTSLTGTPFFITVSNMANPTTIDSQLTRILALSF